MKWPDYNNSNISTLLQSTYFLEWYLLPTRKLPIYYLIEMYLSILTKPRYLTAKYTYPSKGTCLCQQQDTYILERYLSILTAGYLRIMKEHNLRKSTLLLEKYLPIGKVPTISGKYLPIGKVPIYLKSTYLSKKYLPFGKVPTYR